jgi:hypothetical protein
MRFRTETGSVYEIKGHRMRRLTGTRPPTRNQRGEGVWREYTAIVPAPRVGARPLVQWGWEGDVLRQTLLSEVVEVFDGIPLEHDGPDFYLGTPVTGAHIRRRVLN